VDIETKSRQKPIDRESIKATGQNISTTDSFQISIQIWLGTATRRSEQFLMSHLCRQAQFETVQYAGSECFSWASILSIEIKGVAVSISFTVYENYTIKH